MRESGTFWPSGLVGCGVARANCMLKLGSVVRAEALAPLPTSSRRSPWPPALLASRHGKPAAAVHPPFQQQQDVAGKQPHLCWVKVERKYALIVL